MELRKNEIRTMCSELSIREAVPNADGSIAESRTICGKAIAFNSVSDVLYDRKNDKFFREIIAPEACTQEFIDGQDVKLNLLHERGATIARSNKGKGNMKIEVREDGVYFEFEAPKCDIGERCLQMVREGVYTGCSFEFFPDVEKTERRGIMEDGVRIPLLTHRSLLCVDALTIGMDPAYSTTSVEAREIEAILREDTPDEEAEKREAEAKAAAEKVNRERALRALQEDIEDELLIIERQTLS